jgi:hypothetical protein
MGDSLTTLSLEAPFHHQATLLWRRFEKLDIDVYSLLMDASAAVPSGIFVKITRVFPPATHFEEMAAMLWKDEESIVHRLGFSLGHNDVWSTSGRGGCATAFRQL